MKRMGAEWVLGGLPMAASSTFQAMLRRVDATSAFGQTRVNVRYVIELILLMLVCAPLVFIGYKTSHSSASLLTGENQLYPFDLITQSGGDSGEQTTSSVKRNADGMIFSYILGDDAPFSYALAEFSFATRQLVNLSNYSQVTLNLQCQPATHLHLSITTVSKNQTLPATDRLHRPLLEKQFPCGSSAQVIEIAFDTLSVPVWWLNFHDYEFAKPEHDLTQVVDLAIGTTRSTQKHIDHQIIIKDIRLSGRDWKNLTISFVVMAVLWLIWVARIFYRHKRSMFKALAASKVSNTTHPEVKPFQSVADKQVSLLMNFIDKEFDNAELNMEMVISQLGMNKNKINAILKNEVGITFSAYLNQLRMTKSASVLSSNPNASVAEVAFAVGYNNPSYFSKLFKQHHGCSPKDYKPKPEVDLSDK